MTASFPSRMPYIKQVSHTAPRSTHMARRSSCKFCNCRNCCWARRVLQSGGANIPVDGDVLLSLLLLFWYSTMSQSRGLSLVRIASGRGVAVAVADKGIVLNVQVNKPNTKQFVNIGVVITVLLVLTLPVNGSISMDSFESVVTLCAQMLLFPIGLGRIL